MTNISAAQYFCKKFKQYAHETLKVDVICDDNIACLIEYLLSWWRSDFYFRIRFKNVI